VVRYSKPWTSLDEQIERLASRGVDVEPRERTIALLGAVGYYRLTGYLYPFLRSERHVDERGHVRATIEDRYRPGTSISDVAQVLDFDRRLRLLVLDGVERIEVATRMRVGYVLGRRCAFAHLDPDTFIPSFVSHQLDGSGWPTRPSKHADWLERVATRRDGSDEAFVAHFRDKYDGEMPIWALTEILELGHLSRLYQGLGDTAAQEIADAFGAPTKKLMASWLASVNYVRNVAAHHARLFNRKLQNAPGRPRPGVVPLLDHLRAEDLPKGAFGVYNALAVIADLVRSVGDESGWNHRVVALLDGFPSAPGLTVAALGVPVRWRELELWRSVASS
jgi:abortive infection bacteriophage resistance protein